MLRFNPATGRMEEVDDQINGNPLVNRTGPELYPDVVAEESIKPDLTDPSHPYGKPLLGTTDKIAIPEVNPAPAVVSTAPNAIPISGRNADIPVGTDVPEEWNVPPSKGLSVPEIAPIGGVGPGGAPAAPVKPGMQIVGTSSTSGTDADRMTAQGALRQGALNTDVEAEKANSGARSDQEKELAKKNLQISQDTNAQIAAAEKENADRVALQDQAIARFEDHVAAKRAQLESRPLESLMARKSNAAQFLAAISGAVGAYVAIHTGSGRNFAQERIDSAVDRDWKEQEARINNDKDLLALAKQDVQAAELKKKGMLYDLQIKKVALLDGAGRKRSEELAAHGVNTADIAKDEKLVAIQKKRDEESAALKDSFVHDVKSFTVQKAPAATGAGAVNPMAVTDHEGNLVGVATTTPKAAEDARAAMGGYSQFNSAADKLRALIQKNGGTSWSGADAGSMASLHAQLIGAARNTLVKGGGTLDEGFMKLLSQMVDDPSGFSAKPRLVAQMLAKLDRTQEGVDEATRASLGAAGIRTKGAAK